MKKRIISLVLVIVLAIGLCVPAAAAYTQNVYINYRAIKLVLNGERIVPCDGAGATVEPFIMSSSGTTYLPLRAVAQALGLNVVWDGVANTVTLTTGGNVKTGAGPEGNSVGQRKVGITYRNIKIILNGEELSLVNANGDTVEPFILNSNSSVYLPLRVIGEALGLKVGWDGGTSTVSLEGSADESGIKSLTLNATELNLGYKKGYQLQATFNEDAKDTSLTWTSSDESIATVTSEGYVETRTTEGTATITATAVNGRTAKCAVKVEDTCGVTSIGFPVDKFYMLYGDSAEQVAMINEDALDKSVTWTSSNPEVASVSGNSAHEVGGCAIITAGYTDGVATITATAANGISASFTVKVSSKYTLFAKDGMVVKADNDELGYYFEQGWSQEPEGFDVEKEGSSKDGQSNINWKYGEGYLYVEGNGKTPFYSYAPWSSYKNSIRSIYIYGDVSSVGSFGFNAYSGIKHVELSDNVSLIDSYAFDDCALERIGIPASVTNINATAFDTHKKPASSSNGNMVVYCESGSYAHNWAIKNGLQYVEATMVYAADGRTIMVSDSERELYLANGWYTAPVVIVYSAAGEEKAVLETELNYYLSIGWYKNKSDVYTTVYAADGSTKEVLKTDANKLESEGWYAYPVSTVYAADGTPKVVPTSEVDSYVAKGWYKDKSDLYVTMYAIDGRTKEVLKSKVADWQAVGWYLYNDYVAAKTQEYAYLAGTDFRSVRRDYPHAVANYAYVVTFTNLDGDFCVLTYVGYKIISNYTVTTLHNMTTGKTIEDPDEYYKKMADRYWGASKIHYMDLASEVLGYEIKANGAIVSILKDGTDPGYGAYVSAATLNR